jgi:hypothetical protein
MPTYRTCAAKRLPLLLPAVLLVKLPANLSVTLLLLPLLPAVLLVML